MQQPTSCTQFLFFALTISLLCVVRESIQIHIGIVCSMVVKYEWCKHSVGNVCFIYVRKKAIMHLGTNFSNRFFNMKIQLICGRSLSLNLDLKWLNSSILQNIHSPDVYVRTYVQMFISDYNTFFVAFIWQIRIFF